MDTKRFPDDSLLRFPEWVLRGIGQVVFQNNPFSGLVILAAILFNSWIYFAICLLGAIVSTATAMVLRADRALVSSGLFGFNGALVGLSLVAFTSENFRTGAAPSPFMLAYIIFAAAMTSVVFSAIGALLQPYRVAALTAPFVLVGWLFLFAVLRFANIESGPLTKPVSPDEYVQTTQYLLPTWYMGFGNAIGQIFFQDNWITGYAIVVGIAVNSRISAAMALIGAVLAAGVAALFGGPEGAIRDGLFGYNAALTAIALGGFFLVVSWPSFLYALFGVVVTTWLWASIAVFLEPIAMPVLTSTFVLVTWLMLLAAPGFRSLIPVPPAEATTPEDNRKRVLRGPALQAA
ncbi:urea transporter [Phenylobacterium sp.]|jgi:urea transporter|uniref:urea transporter n=1 Tax=Phenylobacterium sp. TaxID=1871053 RepID=UPI002F402F5B